MQVYSLLPPPVEYAQIDWHDFVIVETISFRESEAGTYEMFFLMASVLCLVTHKAPRLFSLHCHSCCHKPSFPLLAVWKKWNFNPSFSFRIAGNFWGRKFSRILWFCGYLWKFSLLNLGAWRPLAWQKQAIHESFLCENRIFHQFAKAFSLKSFPLYGTFKGYKPFCFLSTPLSSL